MRHNPQKRDTGHWFPGGLLRRLSAVAIAAAVALGSVRAFPLEAEVELVGHIGGGINHAAIEGRYAFVAEGYGLAVIDLTDRANPKRVSWVALSDDITDVCVIEGMAYVVANDIGLQIVDVRNPESPRCRGSFTRPHYYPGAVVVRDGIAYTTAEFAGLCVLDVHDPDAPELVGQVGGASAGISLWNEYAFVANWSQGVKIVDVSDPRHPQLVVTFGASGYAQDVAVVDGMAYIADWGGGLKIADVSDLTSPTIVGQWNGFAAWVDVKDHMAFVGNDEANIAIIDCDNPSSPTLVNAYDFPDGKGGSIAISGDVLCASVGYGMHVVDIHDPEDPLLEGTYRATAYPVCLDVENGIAYLGDEYWGLDIIDVSDPSTPRGMANYYDAVTDFRPRAIRYKNGFLYVADWHGLEVIDVQDPTAAQRLAMFPFKYPYDIDLSGTVAFVPSHRTHTPDDPYEGGEIRAFDISDPAAPRLLSSFRTGGYGNLARLTGSVLLTESNDGLAAWDVSDPASPMRLSSFFSETVQSPRDLSIGDRHAFVLDDYSLHAYEMSESQGWQSIGYPYLFGFDWRPWRMAVDEPIGWVVLRAVSPYWPYWLPEWSITALDLGNSEQPRELALFDVPDECRAMQVVNGLLYIANYRNGLAILNLRRRSSAERRWELFR